MAITDKTSKAALVTGSTSGIGLAIAKSLLAQGYFVFFNGRNEEKGATLIESFKDLSVNAVFIAADTSTEAGADKLAHELESRQIMLDVLVTNVGSGRSENSAVVEQSEYQRIFNINFFSAVNVCGRLQSQMKSPSNIVCISSIAGSSPIGAPIAYACAKAALNMFVKEWAMRLASQHIGVNGISPGNVMFQGSVWDNKMSQAPVQTQAYIKDNVPLNAFVTPEEIAQMVLQVVNSPMLTGQNIVIDGGQSKGMN